MGLDMTLYVKDYDFSRDPEKDPYLNKFPKTSTVYEVAYWRKVNSIHKWFVDNVQGGTDDCGEYYVTKEKLMELRDVVRQAVESPAEAATLLPTESGFFFGATDYDDYYFEDLRQTLKMFTSVFELLDKKPFSLYYSSSW